MSYGYVHRAPAAAAPMPSVEFDPAQYAIADVDLGGTTLLSLVVKRVGSLAQASSVDFTTVDGTALGGIQYVPTSGTLNWDVGDPDPKMIPVQIIPTPAGVFIWNKDTLNSPSWEVSGGGKYIDTGDDYGICTSTTLYPRTGKTYFEVALADFFSIFGGQYAKVMIRQSPNNLIGFSSNFQGEYGNPQSNAVYSMSYGYVETAFFPTAVVFGFLVDWDLGEIRVSRDGEWVSPQTGQTFADPGDVFGVSFDASGQVPLQVSAQITEPS